jgi:signal-transduction protein with cAMP-binding, CBS, and nucleotidyltransferase domain
MDPIESILASKGRTLHVTSPAATVLEASRAMCTARVGALLVMDAEHMVGVFSERDLMTRVVLAGRPAETTRVGDVMTREVVCIRIEASPQDAMAVMTRRRVRHLPVTQASKVVGLISIGDLVRWTIRDNERAIHRLEDYVCGRYPG